MPGGRWGQGWHGRFKRRGLRFTFPRQIILEALGRASDYLSAEEVYMQVHRDYPGIGLATVYRTLNLLSDMGLVTKFEFGEGKARYELAENEADAKHHHFLICKNCFKVIKYSDFLDQERDLVEKMEKALTRKYDYSITRHVVQFYGVCPECR